MLNKSFFDTRFSICFQFVGFIVDTSGSDTYCGIVIDTVNKPRQIFERITCVNMGKKYIGQGAVVRKVNSAIHRIVIFSNFLNMLSNW